MSISICIPAYEMNDKGSKYLQNLLQSIEAQQFKDFEVIVSDHSKSDLLKTICNKFPFVNHIFNKENIGSSSANINNAIKNSKFELIKPMFQDDFFTSRDALLKIQEMYDMGKNWGATRFIHYNNERFYNEQIPHYNKNIINGINTIGSPSVIYFKKDNNLLFDENLIWFMDCELYHRLYIKYGEPSIIDDSILVGGRIWDGQVTKTKITNQIIQFETQYIKEKYGR